MKTLQLKRVCTILKLTDSAPAQTTLTDQVSPFLIQAPHLVLDVEGIQFNSMLIGELVNVHRTFEERWRDEEHHIALVNLSEVSRAVFERVRLTEMFPVFGSIGEALNGAS